MECNIDERGAMYRRVWGAMNLVLAAVVVGLALWSGIWWLWIIAAACTGFGVLGLYEAKNKWCIMRAMGVKTRV
jgi:hypothetical protein